MKIRSLDLSPTWANSRSGLSKAGVKTAGVIPFPDRSFGDPFRDVFDSKR